MKTVPTNFTLNDALSTLNWLVSVQDVVHVDDTIENAILHLQELCKPVDCAEMANPALAKYTGDFKQIRFMFDSANEANTDWPKICIGGKWHLTLAANSNGQLNITNGANYNAPDNKWYGRIERATGKISFNRQLPQTERDEILQLITTFDANPPKFAKLHGDATGCCMFCSRKLTDSRSVASGYGPICAETYALPWGNENANQIEMALEQTK